MPEPDDARSPAPDLTEAEFDALIVRAGLELSPAERDDVLATARALRGAAARVRSFVAASLP